MKPLVQQEEDIFLEPKHFESRRAFVGEHEQCAASRRIGTHSLARCLRQAIKAMTQVDWRRADEDTNTTWNHSRSSTASRRSSARSSNATGISRRRDAPNSSTNDADAEIAGARPSTSDDAFSAEFRLDSPFGAATPRGSCSMRY